jgi:putative phosphoesterase
VIAALYDIHGNLPALEAVLDDIRKTEVERLVIGGDVFPGPMARETLDLLLSLDLPVDFISGNGDRDTLALKRGEAIAVPEMYLDAMRWGAEQLPAEHERAVTAWPATLRLQLAHNRHVLFCHATPQNDVDIFTRLTPAEMLVPLFQSVDADLVVCGHTHMQFDRVIGAVRVVNAGSVGMPFGEPGAYWLLLGQEVQFRRTAYDLQAAAARVRETAYPLADQFAEQSILKPPSEAQMVEMFTKR